jgi:hypothetical protein
MASPAARSRSMEHLRENLAALEIEPAGEEVEALR